MLLAQPPFNMEAKQLIGVPLQKILAEMEEAGDLRRHFGLEFVTSSLEKKAEAAVTKAALDQDLTYPPVDASPATEFESGKSEDSHKKSLNNHSSSGEWFVCDDSSTYTRCFVIQGSDSLSSWQSNLLFEPTMFEGTDVLVHRGVYEAAKGIYEQLKPNIMEHLKNGQKILDALGLDDGHVHCVIMHRDIVPRAFSCNYPDHIAQMLKRLHGTFKSHPCLIKNKFIYGPMGKVFILQPSETLSPSHMLLPRGIALYALESPECCSSNNALTVFLNSTHPLETLSNMPSYGSDGTVLRDHDSSNYLKSINGVLR